MVVVCGASTALAATAVFVPLADARVEQAKPTTNFGGSYLATGSSAIQTLIRFQVANVGGAVTSAKLRLHVASGTDNGPGVYPTTGSWTEAGVTWNNRPAATGPAADNLGALTSGTWAEWNVGALVKGNGTVNLLLTQSSTDLAVFDARETSLAPQLVVTWGGCTGPADCDDGNVCTTDTCSSGVCSHTNGGGTCEADGNLCTSDTCQFGTCAAGAPKNCDDGNSCTADTCTPATGACSYKAISGCGTSGCSATEVVETQCNGKDDDCDGLTDWLLPVTANACTGTGAGACGQGYAACLDGARTCLRPPAVAEARNGRDDDCNGLVDDGALPGARPLLARVGVPPSMWSDAPGLVNGVLEVMARVGVPTVGPTSPDPSGTDWAALFTQLNQYNLVIFPGYVASGSISSSQLAALQSWVQAGGVLVVGKPLSSGLQGLAGVSGYTNRSDVSRLRLTAGAPAVLWLDAREERDVLVSSTPASYPLGVHTYTLASGSGAVAFGNARSVGGSDLGPVFVRRPLGTGAVYTLGFDLLRFTSTRCYVNCFDPARDVYAMLLQGATREAGKGHFVRKSPVPGTRATVMLLTHDIDAPDAYKAGAWGDPGAPRMAKLEASRGVTGSYLMTTDYVANYWVPDIVNQLIKLGGRVIGDHSVQHLDMRPLPVGSCSVTRTTYATKSPTLCGEIVVAKQILDALTPSPVVSFRAPYLSVHDQQYPTLQKLGFRTDASLALGDARTAFPVMTAREPALQYRFQGANLVMMPMVQEDGLGSVDNGVESRIELQPAYEAEFLTRWKYAFLQNQANNAWNTMLVHPSYGIGVGPSNLQAKLDATAKFLDFLATQDAAIPDLSEAGEFWRARDAVVLRASWTGNGYSGTLATGAQAVSHFTLEFSDQIGAFSCPGCPASHISGRRLAFDTPLPANSTWSFSATLP
jgi:peptidoglycan/xylan/chitin deacetylase (PgdA/CDA1 family)